MTVISRCQIGAWTFLVGVIAVGKSDGVSGGKVIRAIEGTNVRTIKGAKDNRLYNVVSEEPK